MQATPCMGQTFVYEGFGCARTSCCCCSGWVCEHAWPHWGPRLLSFAYRNIYMRPFLHTCLLVVVTGGGSPHVCQCMASIQHAQLPPHHIAAADAMPCSVYPHSASACPHFPHSRCACSSCNRKSCVSTIIECFLHGLVPPSVVAHKWPGITRTLHDPKGRICSRQ